MASVAARTDGAAGHKGDDRSDVACIETLARQAQLAATRPAVPPRPKATRTKTALRGRPVYYAGDTTNRATVPSASAESPPSSATGVRVTTCITVILRGPRELVKNNSEMILGSSWKSSRAQQVPACGAPETTAAATTRTGSSLRQAMWNHSGETRFNAVKLLTWEQDCQLGRARSARARLGRIKTRDGRTLTHHRNACEHTTARQRRRRRR